jgi:hypothetical protein
MRRLTSWLLAPPARASGTLLVAMVACGDNTQMRLADGSSLSFRPRELADQNACDSGQTDEMQDKHLETPGRCCYSFGNAVAVRDKALARKYYARGCEVYSDANACLVFLGAVIPNLAGGELFDERGNLIREDRSLTDIDGTPVSAEAWKQQVARDYTTADILAVRAAAARHCEAGIQQYSFEDSTGDVCQLAGTSFSLFEPIDNRLALTYYVRACGRGASASCSAARGLGAPISIQAERAAVASATAREESARAKFESALAEQRAEIRQDAAEAERQNNGSAEAFSAALAAGLRANFGGSSGGVGAARPAQGPPPPAPNQPAPPSAGPAQSAPNSCSSDEHVCPPGYGGARVCCPN